MSSLSAMGQGDDETYKPFTSAMLPMPNTRYGVSKLKAETYLQTLEGFPYIIFRPTGVYGPHERDYYLMINLIEVVYLVLQYLVLIFEMIVNHLLLFVC